MAVLVVRHDVADFATWRAAYEAGEALRAKHGGQGGRVLRDASSDSSLLVFVEFPTVEQAQSFAGDPELAATMKSAGVTGPPRIEIYVDA